jgi:putative aminophosphonate oxidoreductase
MRSLWLEEALLTDFVATPKLTGEVKGDVCIVGGGFTGLWTALHLKEQQPALDVVLLEADICGGGASGRNGGFVMSWWPKFVTMTRLCGAEGAVQLCNASSDAIAEIGAFCAQHDIDAHFRADGWLWTASSQAQVGAWSETLELLDHHDQHPFTEMTQDEVVSRSGSPNLLSGVFEASNATVQPALLVRGLRRVALERGVRIFENSAMTKLERTRPLQVHTAAGIVIADRVVLALNAWSGGFPEIPELHGSILVIASDIVATDPMRERLADIGYTSGLAISDSRMMVNYWRNTRDGRVAFGKGGGTLAYGARASSFDATSPSASQVTKSFRGLYPALADVPIARSWAGPIDRSSTGLPFFGSVPGRPDIIFGAGYSGEGVGASHLGGKILASLALGLRDQWSTCALAKGPIGRFPPEPARYLGGLLVRAAVARRERAEDRGRRPGRVTVLVAGLAPAGLVPQKPS